ncbi:MAG TPA: potassium transporter Kup [Azospirillaceae bacterium]|nr:potassium transporter Kup [Azospirillaceae bacterium]
MTANTHTSSTAPNTLSHGEDARRSLVLGALGVVYGDIGTSPLYTVREAFGHAGGLHPTDVTVLGTLSLVLWSLLIVVTLKYVLLILRADNRGEGGVLSLAALGLGTVGGRPGARALIVGLSTAGLALFYGDGLITPAISVLSAVEGLNVATPFFEPYVVPIATAVLVGLFLIQSRGTGRVGVIFGPVMAIWFTVLGVLGLLEIIENPGVLRAIDPRYAVMLFQAEQWQAFIAMGAVVLAVTGAEALYADLGHFGRPPIRKAWFGLVLPGLVLNYFGQGALVLRDPEALAHPFFHLAPDWALYPMVGLATLATIIASQAVISGVFSLTRQAVQLGYLPRMSVRHTSETEIGQVYIPRINYALMVGVLILVIGFGSSGNLAAAYGISVTGAMSIDAILAGIVAATLWGWGPVLASVVFGLLFLCDFAFFAATTLKIPEGGWFPLAIAAVCSFMIITWRRGRRILFNKLYRDAPPIGLFLNRMDKVPQRVAGTAVFMTGNAGTIPHPLLHNLKHNKVLHERIVLMTVQVEEVAHVPGGCVVEVERLGKGFYTVMARYGFMDRPHVPRALEKCRQHGLAIDMMETSFFLGRETLIPSTRPDMKPWQESLFIAINATALSATAYFCIPPDRVVELGTQVEI